MPNNTPADARALISVKVGAGEATFHVSVGFRVGKGGA
jgi:hypothetical protein